MAQNKTEKPDQLPHDDFFKVAFSMKENVRDYIVQYLDKDIVKDIDLQSLTLDTTEYTTAGLKKFYSDVVWQCAYGKDKKQTKMVFLFEHKSSVPKYPHIQILRYQLEIWEQCIKDKKPLTLIIPIIVYHNKNGTKWKYKPFSSYFKDIDTSFFKYIPSFEYHLTDLTRMSANDILELKGLLVNTFLTLQFGSNEEFILQNLEIIFTFVEDEQFGELLTSFVGSQLIYLTKNTAFTPKNIDIIYEHLRKNSTIMTTYDRIVERGVAQGIEQGIEQGVAKGLEQGIEQGVAKGLEQGVAKGMEKGLEKGLEKGDELRLKSVISKMLQKGFSLSDIAELADITIDKAIFIINKYELK
jgi:predicted transposase/invertase (TIGR01784 family)